MWKPKFLERFIQDPYIEEYDDVFDDAYGIDDKSNAVDTTMGQHISLKDMGDNDSEDLDSGDLQEGATEAPSELTVDVYQTPEEIIVRTMIAGVPPSNVDISLTRDMITITGSREEAKEVTEDDYFYRELFWGSFTRTIMLPAEIEVDGADAQERYGVLTIRLSKINKERQAKIKVKSR